LTLGLTYAITSLLQVGNISSWSAYSNYRSQLPDHADSLEEFQQELITAQGAADGTTPLHFSTPIALQLARKPSSMRATQPITCPLQYRIH